MPSMFDRIPVTVGPGATVANQRVHFPLGVVLDQADVPATVNAITFDNVAVVSPIAPGNVRTAGSFIRVTLTSNAVYTLNAPTGLVAGQQVTVQVRNTIGGAAGAMTFAATYKLGAAWTQPATGFSRTIVFLFDGTNLVEVGRTAADVAN